MQFAHEMRFGGQCPPFFLEIDGFATTMCRKPAELPQALGRRLEPKHMARFSQNWGPLIGWFPFGVPLNPSKKGSLILRNPMSCGVFEGALRKNASEVTSNCAVRNLRVEAGSWRRNEDSGTWVEWCAVRRVCVCVWFLA